MGASLVGKVRTGIAAYCNDPLEVSMRRPERAHCQNCQIAAMERFVLATNGLQENLANCKAQENFEVTIAKR